jgi:hypothetical protein
MSSQCPELKSGCFEYWSNLYDWKGGQLDEGLED